MYEHAMDPTSAQDALDQISEAKRVVLKRPAPRGYWAGMGLLFGVLTVSVSTPMPWIMVGDGVALVLLVWLLTWHQRATGVAGPVNTETWRILFSRTAWLYWVLAVVSLVAVGVATVANASGWTGSVPSGIVLGVLLLCGWSVLGPIQERTINARVSECK